MSTFDEAKLEWDQIGQRDDRNPREFDSNVEQNNAVSHLHAAIDFRTAWISLTTHGISRQMLNDVNLPSGYNAIPFFICIKNQLSSDLIDEMKQIVLLSKEKFNDCNPIHLRILGSVYKNFLEKPCLSRFGQHWDQLGFQGHDPATDLRSTGVMGLLQLLYFVENFPLVAKEMLNQANRGNTFPFSTVSINCSLHSMQCLKSSRLNAEIACFGSALIAVNLLHIGQLIMYAKRWIEENKSIAEAGFLLVDVKKMALKKPAKLIKIAQQANEQQTKRNLFQTGQQNDEIVARFDSID